MVILLVTETLNKLLTTLQLKELKPVYVNRQVSFLIDLPLRRRIKAEEELIDKGYCPNCGSSLEDIANHLEGDTLNYQCTYCKTN